MDADGGNQHALARAPSADEYQASYSPSGKRLLYTRHVQDRPHEIWISRADGTNPRRLTAGSSAGWRTYRR
jgi:Tol biopolymer transport system component